MGSLLFETQAKSSGVGDDVRMDGALRTSRVQLDPRESEHGSEWRVERVADERRERGLEVHGSEEDEKGRARGPFVISKFQGWSGLESWGQAARDCRG